MSTDKQTEEKIFESATEIFLIKGMDGARMQDIADHAGINKSLLHYYFRSKEKLFNAVAEALAKKMFSRLAPIFNQEMSLEDKIKLFFDVHISFLQNNPRLPIFVLNEMHRSPQHIKKIFARLNIEKMLNILAEQHKAELGDCQFPVDNLIQIITSIVSLSIFPFAAREAIESILGKTDTRFDDYLEARKAFASEFVIGALKNENLNKLPTATSISKSKKGKSTERKKSKN